MRICKIRKWILHTSEKTLLCLMIIFFNYWTFTFSVAFRSSSLHIHNLCFTIQFFEIDENLYFDTIYMDNYFEFLVVIRNIFPLNVGNVSILKSRVRRYHNDSYSDQPCCFYFHLIHFHAFPFNCSNRLQF